jgi:restriction endonuclease S subunit
MSKFKRYERYKDSGVDWIGEIPEHWEKMSLKMLASNEKNSFVDGPFGSDLKNEEYQDDGIPLIQLNNIVDGKHILQNIKYISEEKAQELCRHVIYPNDIVIAKMAYPVARAARVNEEYDKYVIVADCVRLKPNITKCDVRFLVYVINCPYVRSQAEIVASGTTRLRISLGSLKNLQVFLPTLDEQKSIADYLDQKTAEIDGLIADKEKLIELLQEKRQAIITEAVTKGLNPNVRLKDSGIEWIGEIPEHWNLRRIRYLANIRNVKASDSDIDKTYVGLENIESKTGKLLTNGDDEQQFVGETANIFKKGDVLFGKLRPYLAKCIIADFDGRCTSELLVLKTTSYILPKYLHIFMLSPKFIDVVNSSTYGAKMPRASWDFIGNLEIPLPSIKEQEDIVEYLTEFISRIDDLISDINTQIQKLKEYRQSLISEAVTGKIDVRDYVVSN